MYIDSGNYTGISGNIKTMLVTVLFSYKDLYESSILVHLCQSTLKGMNKREEAVF